VLKRVVAYKKAWKLGLQGAWGDPSLVSDNDVLRYRWPSISKGWEEGLVNFSRERFSGAATYRGGDVKLLSDVVNLPNTKVYIIHGTKDKVIPFAYSQNLARIFSKVQVEPLDGLGHTCFEEKPDEFARLVEQLLLSKTR